METIKKVITDFMLFHYKEDNIEIFKTLFEGEEINTVEDVIRKMIDIYECEGKPEYLKSGSFNLAGVNARAFVEEIGNLAEYIDGKHYKDYKGNYIPVIEYNELRKAADEYDSLHVR